jgi:hypothetical protein
MDRQRSGGDEHGRGRGLVTIAVRPPMQLDESGDAAEHQANRDPAVAGEAQ